MRILNYIGSKTKLIKFIKKVLEDNNLKEGKLGDLFAGTGVVGYNLMDNYDIISNDVEYYSYIINYALLKCKYTNKIKLLVKELDNLELNDYDEDIHLISKYYSKYGKNKRLFWSKENSLKADFIMNEINRKKLNTKERIFLLASLIVSLDRVANTTSVYGAYLKKLKKVAEKKFILEPIHEHKKIVSKNDVSNKDILDIDDTLDIVYLDPPYNNRQYGSNYGPLNFIAKYDKSIIPYGKTGLIPHYYKSDFCVKSKASDNMKKLIQKLKCNKILISYNNEGLITEDEFKTMLKNFGYVKLYKLEYSRYKSNNEKQTANKVYEYLYFLDKTGPKNKTVKEIILDKNLDI